MADITSYPQATPDSTDLVLGSKQNALGKWHTKTFTVSSLLSGIPSNIDGTAGTIPVFTDTNAIGDSVIIQNSNNIGIGTTNPSEKLEVDGNARITGDVTVAGAINVSGTLANPSVFNASGLPSSTVVDFLGSAYFAPNAILKFGGTSAGLSIYQDDAITGDSIISDNGPGNLRISGKSQIQFRNQSNGELYAVFNENAAVTLYYDNVIKFETTSYGVDLPEDLSLAGKLIDSNDSPGTAGQVLSSTATGTEWVAASSGGFTGNVTLGQIPFGNSTLGGVLGGSNDFTINTTGGQNGKPIIGVGVDVTSGSHNPKGGIEVNSWIDFNGSPFNYFIPNNTTPTGYPVGVFDYFSGTDVFAISYWGAGRFMGSGIHIFSDERIKKDISVSNSAEDLETISKIEISDYTHIDPIKGGKEKKVIAQQVKEHYPAAVSEGTDCVPDIFKQGKIKDGVIDFVFECEVGDKIKIMHNKASHQIVEVLEIKQDGVKVNCEVEGDIFVYGKEVDDYHTVDYNALSMLNISATQELYKIINELKQEIEALKAGN